MRKYPQLPRSVYVELRLWNSLGIPDSSCPNAVPLGRVLTLWRLLHMLCHFDPPFLKFLENWYSFDHLYIFEQKWGKCHILTHIFCQKLAICIVLTPPSTGGAQHAYPKPNREPPTGHLPLCVGGNCMMFLVVNTGMVAIVPFTVVCMKQLSHDLMCHLSFQAKLIQRSHCDWFYNHPGLILGLRSANKRRR